MLHRREDDQMLGGMLALPTGAWIEDAAEHHHLESMDRQALTNIGRHIKHSFTHFDLTLHIYRGQMKKHKPEEGYEWVPKVAIKPSNFPTVFKKAVVLCQGE